MRLLSSEVGYPRGILEGTHRGYPYGLRIRGMLSGRKHESDNQCVNSDSFGEGQTDEHVHADQRLCFRVTANGIESLTGGDTNSEAWSNGSEADCQCNCNGVNSTSHEKNPPYGQTNVSNNL